jgi:regulator of protease activity HflC (stomatin/prohibitin superfamily)
LSLPGVAPNNGTTDKRANLARQKTEKGRTMRDLAKQTVETLRNRWAAWHTPASGRKAEGGDALPGARPLTRSLAAIGPALPKLAIVGALAAIGYAAYNAPPVLAVQRGEVVFRSNTLTGNVTETRDGMVWVLPRLHTVRVLSLRDKAYRPEQSQKARGAAPFQSVEGLSFGVDLTVRYALDATKLATTARRLPDNIEADIVAPAVQGVVYKAFARYTVREAFSTKRADIQKAIEAELLPKLAADGIVLKSVQIGQIDLPDNYKRGMETLLAEELEAEKMRYTLDLQEKRIAESGFTGEAEKVAREKKAEAAAREQIIAAKAQEEAMKHILPLKQRQIEQRQLEAEAERVARVRAAEGAAQARQIEAKGEAEARQKLADAEAYRLDRVGKTQAEQMRREGALVTAHPLLIQKTLADKLSDKIQVIIASPPADGGFVAANLLGRTQMAASPAVAQAKPSDAQEAGDNPNSDKVKE